MVTLKIIQPKSCLHFLVHLCSTCPAHLMLGLNVYAHCHNTAEKNIYTTLLPLNSWYWYNLCHMMSTHYEGPGFPFITFCIHGLNFFRIRQFTIHVPLTLKISYYYSSWHGMEGDTPVEQVTESTSCSSSWSRCSHDKYCALHQQWMKTTQ